MSIANSLIMELEQEAQTTRKVLERVPDDKLTWKPHPKSMSLGQLAQHIASVPGGISRIATLETFDASNLSAPPQPESTAAVLAALEESVANARKTLENMDDAVMMRSWSLTLNGKAIMTLPRVGLFRTILFNHLYHHRGQLSVYLRLIDVPVPSIYGPSADDNPFI